MPNINSSSKSRYKVIINALEQTHDQQGFNVVYEEKDLSIDLPKLTFKNSQDFLNALDDIQDIEKTINEKYEIRGIKSNEGTITLAPEIKLAIVLK